MIYSLTVQKCKFHIYYLDAGTTQYFHMHAWPTWLGGEDVSQMIDEKWYKFYYIN